MFGVFFYVSLFVQHVLGYSPIQAGASFLPMTVLIILLAPQSGRLSDRVGSRWLWSAACLDLTVSLILFSRWTRSSSFWNLLPALIARRHRDGDGDDPDDGGGDAARYRRTRPASARRC